jgi:hypothetical protein
MAAFGVSDWLDAVGALDINPVLWQMSGELRKSDR